MSDGEDCFVEGIARMTGCIFKGVCGEWYERSQVQNILARLKDAEEVVDETIKFRGCEGDCCCKASLYRRKYPDPVKE